MESAGACSGLAPKFGLQGIHGGRRFPPEKEELMEREPYAGRLICLRRTLEEQQIDTFLVAVPQNRYYLSGYAAEDLHPTESSGYLLIAPSKQYLLTDFRYQEEAAAEAPDFQLLIYREGLGQVLSELFVELPVERLGVEPHYLSVTRYREVEEALKKSRPRASVVSVEEVVERQRLVKEPDEISAIKASLAVTEKVLGQVWQNLKAGRAEKEVAWEIERSIREDGAEAVSFPPIVASGPNAALPHAVPTDRRIEGGDPVILDLGSKLNHYCSDMTRTWIAGAPHAKLREIYRIVREAQLEAQDFIGAGKESAEVDAVARNLIARAGYGENFGHGLGHGVGLAVHEKPGLRKQKGMILEENMVVTIEPGIYLPGFGGVRLENMVRITQNGCELLNQQMLFYE
jgi:Xaa-Pro aminopeptidase